MLSGFSVKKPFYVLVAVIICLVLGGVSLNFMKTNLFPDVSVPYLAVITTDIGASPEQVKTDVTDVLEDELSSVSGVKNVISSSAENFSLIMLEFVDGTDMDSALVKVSAACNKVASKLPETAATPTYMEMTTDMMASMYLGVTDDNKDLNELTELVEDTVIPALERLNGVATVQVAGGVIDTISIELDQDKIDLVNDGILGETNSKLSAAKDQIDQGQMQLTSALNKLDSSEAQLLESQKKVTSGQAALDGAKTQANASLSQLETINAMKASYQAQIGLLQTQIQIAQSSGDTAKAAELSQELQVVQGALNSLEQQAGEAGSSSSAVLTLVEQQRQLDQATNSISQGLAAITTTRAQLKGSQKELDEGRKTYEENREAAVKKSNINQLLNTQTLSQLIAAQNFEMPAGYVDNGNEDERWLVKAGENFDNVDELKNLVLTRIDGVGDVTLNDVANVIVTNNQGDSYANLNGTDGLVLSVVKNPTANMGDVSEVVNDQLTLLQNDNEGLSFIKIMDQGDYIDLYISTILKTLLLGALLAIIVLAVFLRDIKPTLIVAFAIPFSVLFALVVMYFTGLELNIMTLGAMSVAIGMLVDNGIVVMENIYRLRQKGYSPARAAAQGARQVSGAVIASTVTSICVFLPMVFSSGTVRELLIPFALTLSYVLVASLLVALTVVPALSSVLFKNMKPRESQNLGKVQTLYGRSLEWCLKHKAPVLVLAVVLLAGSIFGAFNTGIVLVPEMTSNQLMLMLTMPEDTEKDEGYKVADEAVDRILAIDGVSDVGCVDSNFTTDMAGGDTGDIGDMYSGEFIMYVMIDESKVTTEKQVKDLSAAAQEVCSDLPCEVVLGDSMESSNSMTGAGLSLIVSGLELEDTINLSEQVMEVVDSVDGYEEIENGLEDADETLHLYFDKNKVAHYGLTVAQIYQELAADLNTSATAFTMTREDGNKLDVKINSERFNPVTKDNLMDWTFEDTAGKEHKLSSVATLETERGVSSIEQRNNAYYCTVNADITDGYNTTLLMRQLQPKLDAMDIPNGYSVEVSGADEAISEMIQQMVLLMCLGFLLVYLVMVAQFQSLLSPFIIILTVPLAFTGGFFALIIAGEQLSVISLLGMVILMGTVVNNGIVFVDYVNQLRMSGVAKRAALIATGQTRMRPIFMTALTTILAMCAMIFSQEIGSSMQRGMALVVAGGLLYATIMTLYVVPIIYDLFSRRPMRPIDLGDEIDDDVTDAQDVINRMGPDAIEKYDYETSRERRARKKRERGAHGSA